MKNKFREGVLLSQYTTIKIGGPAKLFREVKIETELVEAVREAVKLKVPYLLIGSGSNLIVSDEGFDGLAIWNRVKGIKITEKKLLVKSGTTLQELINFTNKNGFSGLQKLTGIPGTVGGAIFGNAGAYGQSVSDCLTKIKVFDGKKVFWLKSGKAGFNYRESLFKKTKDLILEAEFKLQKGESQKLEEESRDIMKTRLAKYSPQMACAGSFFKNIPVANLSAELLQRIPKEKIVQGKIPAGYLMEEVGAKGAQKGEIKIADWHANFPLNLGKGKATDLLFLMKKFQDKVKKRFGINLEPEVQIVSYDQKIAVLGLGMEGKDLVNYLVSQGSEVTVFDEKSQSELDFTGIQKDKIQIVCGPGSLAKITPDFAMIFRSPGIYRFRKEILIAEKRGIIISSAIKLFFALCPGTIIGVTGTKGKGTTSTLIYQMMKEAGFDVYLAGNIGQPYLSLLPKLNKNSFVILELSSFQLIDLDESPKVAVVLNITSDHLNWHQNQKEYFLAKANIVKHQKTDDLAVINFDYPKPKSLSKLTKAKVFYFSRKSKVKNGCFVKNGQIIMVCDSKETLIGETKKLLLRGKHNWENLTAAITVVSLVGVKLEMMKKVVFSFKGLEHRLEEAGRVGGVFFYNDSFATGPQASMAAIRSFDEPMTLILGGYDKNLDYQKMGLLMAKKANIKNVILIGQVAPKINQALKKAHFSGTIVLLHQSKMVKIVAKAYHLTKPKGVVLLSPAAASFDMFKDYKDRGHQFKKAVLALAFAS